MTSVAEWRPPPPGSRPGCPLDESADHDSAPILGAMSPKTRALCLLVMALMAREVDPERRVQWPGGSPGPQPQRGGLELGRLDQLRGGRWGALLLAMTSSLPQDSRHHHDGHEADGPEDHGTEHRRDAGCGKEPQDRPGATCGARRGTDADEPDAGLGIGCVHGADVAAPKSALSTAWPSGGAWT